MAIVDSIATPDIVPPSMAENALAWTGRYWTTLAMIGVAMFSLLVLKSVVKGAPTSGSPAGAVPALTIHAEQAGADDRADSNAPPRARLRIKKGVSLKDDLAEMVREDPDSAAAILKSWIGKAG